MKEILSFFTFIILSLTVLAQEEIQLDSLITKARTYPLTMNKVDENYILITKQDIQSTPSQSVEELIAYQTGIDLRRRGIDGMQGDISIRGGSFEQVLLIINGVRLSDTQTGHNLWNLPFDLSSIERIEVIKGPAARKFGSNAFAGVIHIITKVEDENSISVGGMGGSYGTYDVGFSANAGTSKFKNSISANYGASDGYRYNTDYKKTSAYYQSSYDIQEGQINLQAGFVEKKFGANGFYASPSFKDQYEETQNSIVSLGLDKKINNWGFKASTYWKRAQDMYLLKRNDPSFYRNMHIGNNMGVEASASFINTLGVTGIGAEFRKEMLRSNSLGSRDREISSIFLEHNFSLFERKLNITPGFNWTNYSNRGDFFYPGLEIGYEINKFNKLYAHAAKVHRIPSYTELFYDSPVELGNENLNPETANSFELGYRYVQPTFVGKLSLFYKQTDDAIDWVKQNESDAWQAYNVADIDVKGVELTMRKNFVGFISALELGYTYLDKSFANEDFEMSKNVLDNLRNHVVLKMENQLYKDLRSGITFRYLDRVALDNYSLLDAKLDYRKSNWNLFTSFNNILGTDYTESSLVPMPGFWFSLGANYKFKF